MNLPHAVKKVAPSIGLFLAATTFADTEITGSVSVELIKQLFGNPPMGEVNLYSDLADEFPPLFPADSMTLLGSYTNSYQRVAVFESANPTDSVEAMRASMLENGWRELPITRPRQASGFVNSNAIPVYDSVSLCQDPFGQLSLSPRVDSNTVVASSYGGGSVFGRQQNCAQQIVSMQQQSSGMIQRQTVHQHLPRLESPASVNQAYASFNPVFIGGGSGGGNYDARTDARLSYDGGLEELFNHYLPQLAEQDWALDSSQVGATAASASWTRSPEAGVELVGTLTISVVGEDNYDLYFRLVTVE